MEDASPDKKRFFLLLIKSISKCFWTTREQEKVGGDKIRTPNKKQMPHTLELCFDSKVSKAFFECFVSGNLTVFGGDQRCLLVRKQVWALIRVFFSKEWTFFRCYIVWVRLFLSRQHDKDKDIHHRSHIDLLCGKIKHIFEWVLIKKRSEFHFS